MTGAVSYLLDTNILLRFLMQDNEEHAAAAKRLFERAKAGKARLVVPFTAVSETVHTLRTFYGVERAEIAGEVLKILKGSGVSSSAPEWIFEALEDFRRRAVSFGDACLAAEARLHGLPVASFDRGLDGFQGVERFEPK